MAADGGDAIASLTAPAQRYNANTPLLATSAIPEAQRFPISKWAPHTGRTEAFRQHRRDVLRLCAALGISEADLHHNHPPNDINVNIKAEDRVETRASKAAALEEWQRKNTALFWHYEPSLILTGPDKHRDERTIDAMVNGHCARGRTLILWAFEKAETTSLKQQTELTAKVGAAKLKAGATWTELDMYVQGLYDKWSRIAINVNAPSLMGFWSQLLVGLPTEPAGSHLCTLRIWLAGWVLQYGQLEAGSIMPKGSPRLHRLDDALEDIKVQASIFGLPVGDWNAAASQTVVMALGGGNDLLQPEHDGAPPVGQGVDTAPIAGGQIAAIGARPPPNSGAGGSRTGAAALVNRCSYCDANACQSDTLGGRPKCICLHTSAFKTDKLTRGMARYVALARAYHKQHPNAPTLKNIKFTVKPGGTAKGTAASGAVLLLSELLADGEDPSELDAWLAEHECTAPGIWGLGDLGEYVTVDGTPATVPAPATDTTASADQTMSREAVGPSASPDSVSVGGTAVAELARLRSELAAAQSALAARPNGTPPSAAVVTPVTPGSGVVSAALPADLVPLSPELLALARGGGELPRPRPATPPAALPDRA